MYTPSIIKYQNVFGFTVESNECVFRLLSELRNWCKVKQTGVFKPITTCASGAKRSWLSSWFVLRMYNATVTCFPAPGACCMFSRAWRSLYVFPRLAPMFLLWVLIDSLCSLWLFRKLWLRLYHDSQGKVRVLGLEIGHLLNRHCSHFVVKILDTLFMTSWKLKKRLT